MNLNTEISNSFNRSAASYERVAKIQQEIGERLFERLQYLKIQPRYILDVGCGPGIFLPKLKRLYPKAHVVGLDLAYLMLKQSQLKQKWRSRFDLVNCDMSKLPFANGSFDLIFSNQVLHWSNPLHKVLGELNRVLVKDGCLMFSTLGPDTFKELKRAFYEVDDFAHVNDFMDLHDIGDCLLKESFLDPVMDMEYLTAKYTTAMDMFRSLKDQGVKNIHTSRKKGLTSKRAWHQVVTKIQDLSLINNGVNLTYEIIYGHAWKGSTTKVGVGVETSVSLETLRQQLKKMNIRDP